VTAWNEVRKNQSAFDIFHALFDSTQNEWLKCTRNLTFFKNFIGIITYSCAFSLYFRYGPCIVEEFVVREIKILAASRFSQQLLLQLDRYSIWMLTMT
jgi:hypothetical protein